MANSDLFSSAWTARMKSIMTKKLSSKEYRAFSDILSRWFREDQNLCGEYWSIIKGIEKHIGKKIQSLSNSDRRILISVCYRSLPVDIFNSMSKRFCFNKEPIYDSCQSVAV